ncbi:DUF3515 domain-containing protein [Actinocatenispora rupis]|uniref:DUF3515 domain-containing protein n=1 Tax=Actinocatenispora rupis TaxID=519421 RepID=A0A8J3NCU9_9ACTN|nr:DUF3515 domain-containing protein [Actinocatenispora rupis]GID14376.1 hypothetical protein Aru02nite_52650 [Actinocatenispora rupis]
MADEVSRSAAKTATLVALPITLLAGVLAFWLLGGFGGGAKPKASPSPTPQPSTTVAVPPRTLAEPATTVCRGFIAQLPGTVRGKIRRPVSAGPEQNAAYGQPPVTVACGVPAPKVAPTATVYALSGVCYLPTKTSAGTVWTTVDRQVPVAVTVPGDSGSGQWAAEFSDTIANSVKSLAKAPSGCG